MAGGGVHLQPTSPKCLPLFLVKMTDSSAFIFGENDENLLPLNSQNKNQKNYLKERAEYIV